jgi:cell division protease FtsH
MALAGACDRQCFSRCQPSGVTGAQDDLQKATDIARSMVTEYGMSEQLGLRTFERERRGLFLDTPWATKKDYSEEKAAAIDKEVEDILERAHRQVQELLTAKKPLLEQLAGLLLEKEVLEGEELRRVIGAAADSHTERKRATIH